MKPRFSTRAVVTAAAVLMMAGVQEFEAQETIETPPATPADSAYREARHLLNMRNYARSADAFRAIQQGYFNSQYTDLSRYWEAYSRYRMGGVQQLQNALALLQSRENMENRTERMDAEAAALRARINALLAQSGSLDRYNYLVADVNWGSDENCDRETMAVKAEALRALATMGPDRALASIRRVLENQDQCTIGLRRQALLVLPNVASDGEVEELASHAARTDSSPRVKETALTLLGHLETESSSDLLAHLALSVEDEALRRRAMLSLSRSNPARAQQLLRQLALAADTDENIRVMVMHTIGQMRNPESVQLLTEVYSRFDSPDLKRLAMQMIAGHPGDEQTAWLVSVATDRTAPADLRKPAMFFATQRDVDLSIFLELYDSEESPEMKNHLFFVISQYQNKDPRALDVIIDVARNSEDASLKRQAIARLVQSDDPRAVEVIVEVLEQ